MTVAELLVDDTDDLRTKDSFKESQRKVMGAASSPTIKRGTSQIARDGLW